MESDVEGEEADVRRAMIEAGAQVLLNSPSCDLSLGLAEDCAEAVLRDAASAARDRPQTVRSDSSSL
jgi:hypothetical protein